MKYITPCYCVVVLDTEIRNNYQIIENRFMGETRRLVNVLKRRVLIRSKSKCEDIETSRRAEGVS